MDSASVKLLVEELNVKFKSLQVLKLSNNDIRDDGAIILAEGFKFNCPIKELNLSNNNITTT